MLDYAQLESQMLETMDMSGNYCSEACAAVPKPLAVLHDNSNCA